MSKILGKSLLVIVSNHIVSGSIFKLWEHDPRWQGLFPVGANVSPAP